jgi:hypothetical protein
MPINKPKLLNQLIVISLPFIKNVYFNIPRTILYMRKQAAMLLLHFLFFSERRGFDSDRELILSYDKA